jgi:hypothetical protein
MKWLLGAAVAAVVAFLVVVQGALAADPLPHTGWRCGRFVPAPLHSPPSWARYPRPPRVDPFTEGVTT